MQDLALTLAALAVEFQGMFQDTRVLQIPKEPRALSKAQHHQGWHVKD